MAADTRRHKEDPGRQEMFEEDKDALGALPDGRYSVKGLGSSC